MNRCRDREGTTPSIRIYQPEKGYRFSIDSVLLADFAARDCGGAGLGLGAGWGVRLPLPPPPCRKRAGGGRTPPPGKEAARHEVACTMADVYAAAGRYLPPRGRFSLLSP